MFETINQCCYTHQGAWTAVAQKGNFDQKYVGELSRHSTLPGPEYGSDFSVFETVGYGDKILIMRTQYGLRDLSTDSGRASMFSHGYLFDLKPDEFDPNDFLTVTKDNFCTDTLSAEAARDSFVRAPEYTLSDAIIKAGLDDKSYPKLIKCVYQLSVRSLNKQALMIKSDSDEQSMALLYCIYAGLIPRYARNLSSASAMYNFSDTRNIVFVREINSTKKYFIPETGENNVLSVNIEKNLDSLLFVDYCVSNFDNAENFQEYYKGLEETLASITTSKQVDDETIKLAHIMAVDPVPSKNCDILDDDEKLLSALELVKEYYANNENDFVKQYIEKLQAEAENRGLLAEETPEPATPETAFQDYQQSDFGYQQNGDFNLSGAQNGKSYLGSASFGGAPQTFVNQQQSLTDFDVNRHQQKIYKFAKDGPKEIDNLIEYVKTKILNDDRIVSNAEKAKQFFEMLIKALKMMIDFDMKALDVRFYKNPLKCVDDWGKQLCISPEKIEQEKNSIIAKYWDEFDFSGFNADTIFECASFKIDNPEKFGNIPNAQYILDISGFVNGILEVSKEDAFANEDDWLSQINSLCCNFNSVIAKKTPKDILSILRDMFVKRVVSDKSSDFFKDSHVQKNVVTFVIVFNKDKCKKGINLWKYIFDYMKGNVEQENRRNMYGTIISEIEEFCTDISNTNGFNAIKNLLKYLDSESTTVPFDFWFALGMSKYSENPFEFFDLFPEGEKNYEPKVMKRDVGEIVKTSKYLTEAKWKSVLANIKKKESSVFIKGLQKVAKRL